VNTGVVLQLYAIPFACSLASHIALREAGVPHRIEWVRRRSGADDVDPVLARVNPQGKVATLVLEDGSTLTENIAVLLYIAERGGPLAAPVERFRLYEALSFIATEIHKQVLTQFFDPVTPEAMRAHVPGRLATILAHPAEVLARQPYLLGEQPSVADAYLFWSLVLVPRTGVSLATFPALAAYYQRLAKRDAFAAALAAERAAFTTQQEAQR
jgi:glutathione S-transferase